MLGTQTFLSWRNPILGTQTFLGALPLTTKKEKKIFGPFIFSRGLIFRPREFLIFGANSGGVRGGRAAPQD